MTKKLLIMVRSIYFIKNFIFLYVVHMKVTTNGALRIFHARKIDAGTYACYANGIQGNVTLAFKHRNDEDHVSNLVFFAIIYSTKCLIKDFIKTFQMMLKLNLFLHEFT